MRENKNLEFKEGMTNTFLKTVSAFSNYGGGQVVFGVDDNGKVVGVQNPKEFSLAVENKINDNISPMPEYTLQIGADNTVTLIVMEGTGKPYFYKSKAYKRNDTATVEVDTTELTRLILEGKHITFDEVRSKKQDLTFKKLKEWLVAKAGIENFNTDTLKTLNLYSNEDGFNNAAAILADKNHFPGVDIARFGETINVILKRKTIGNQSVLTVYQETLEVFRDYYTYEVISGFAREKKENIPEEAFREAIANALIHRCWDIQAHIKVAMFDDRIEVVSPGGLPSGIQKEHYLNGNLSVLRNPILANVFFRLNLVEIFGTGIMRIKEAYKGSVRQPEFEMDDNMIKMTLPLLQAKPSLSESEETVYALLSKVNPRGIGEIVPETGFGRSKVRNILKGLAEKGIVVTEGNQRGTKYRLS